MAGPVSHLHRWIWPRLPRGLRRAVLHYGTAAAAPRPDREAAARSPILVAGALSTASGLGQSARLSYAALRACGIAARGVDLSADLMQPVDLPGASFEDGRLVEGPGTIILHVNSPLVPLAMLRMGRGLIKGKRIVGYWAWELPSVPADWRHGVPFVHEIWVPSRFVATAIEPIAGGRPVHVVPHPVAVGHAAPVAVRTRADPRFTVLTIFNVASGFSRKNPLAAIAAFRRAFGVDEGVRLVIKTVNQGAYPAAAALMRTAIGEAHNITMLTGHMSEEDVAALFADADVVLSLHRSEGFGLILAEAMLQGVPVVATDWSGNVDFLSPQTGIPVPYHLVPAEDPQGTYHHPEMTWADPEVEAAAAALVQLRDRPDVRQSLGQAAATYAAATWSATSYCSKLQAILRLA